MNLLIYLLEFIGRLSLKPEYTASKNRMTSEKWIGRENTVA